MTALAQAIPPAVVRKTDISPEERLIVALDVPTVSDARAIVKELGSSVSFYKVGMQLQFSGGRLNAGGGLAFALELINQGKKVFLDSKLWDIEQTISYAVENVADMGVTFLTVHGDRKAIEAAVKARGSSALKILAVTFLTNLDEHDLKDLGYTLTVRDFVLNRARVAVGAGADGVIASVEETPAIRAMAKSQLAIVVPGIRPHGAPRNDQRRVGTPSEAMRAGADYLVIGRPILNAPSKGESAAKIIREIEAGLSQKFADLH